MKARDSRWAVGVVGCGYWGPNLIRNFDLLPECRVVALCDTNAERLVRMSGLFPASVCFRSFERMLLESELDAVAIATPVRSHFRIAKACLLAGKHVLIEKPMAASSAECEELVVLARKYDRVLMVDHTYLHSPSVRKISELIAGGEIGDLRCINAQRLSFGLFQNDINAAWDLAPHDLSIILHLMGDSPLSLNCFGHSTVTAGIEDVTVLSLEFPGGRHATIQSSWIEPRKVRRMTFVGSRKTIVYDDLQPVGKVRIHDVRVEKNGSTGWRGGNPFSYHQGDCEIAGEAPAEPLAAVCRHFLDCIARRKRPLTCGKRGTEVVRILEAANASLRAGGVPMKLHAPSVPAAESAGLVELPG